jgi:hypothetical protein
VNQEICLANLGSKTQQEVFDYVARHLLTQGRRAEANGLCKYRTEDGLRCAAGCLIAVDEYKAEWEGGTWRGLSIKGAVTAKHDSLVRSLQKIHDHCHPSRWRTELTLLAQRSDLDPSVPSNWLLEKD